MGWLADRPAGFIYLATVKNNFRKLGRTEMFGIDCKQGGVRCAHFMPIKMVCVCVDLFPIPKNANSSHGILRSLLFAF